METMETRSLLPATWEVPPIFRQRLGDKVGRQRTMQADGHLLLVTHCPPEPDEDSRRPRFFWRHADGTWRSSDLGSGPNAISKHLDQFAQIIQSHDEREEAAVSADDYFTILSQLAPVHRATRNLYNVLQDARKLCPEDRNLINFRDRAYDIERTAELLYNDAHHALDYAVAKRAEEQARSSHRMAISAHRLNMLVAVFFPIATLSTMFGTNLQHNLEQVAAPWPFLLVMALGLTAGFVLLSLVTKPEEKGEG